MKFLKGIKEVIDAYEGFIIDVFGVMHNGGACFPDALSAIKLLQSHSKRILFLSNAPERSEEMKNALNRKGLQSIEGILHHTSGEEFYRAVYEGFLFNAGQKVFLLGEPSCINIFCFPFEVTESMEEADMLLCFSDEFANKSALLQKSVDKGLNLVCANPDFMRYFNLPTQMGVGEVAQSYENLGGSVIYFEKPFPQIYKTAFSFLDLPMSQILAIGDGLQTDIKGANTAGIDSIYIGDNIKNLRRGDKEMMPTYLMETLKP